MKPIVVLSICLLFALHSFAQQQADPMEGMKTYYLVFLKKGPNRTHDSVTQQKIQEGHLAHLTKMAVEEKMDLAGPILEDGDIRGICVYNTATMEEAKSLAEADPAVKAGRLIVEIRPWYAMKGSCLK